MRSWVFCCKYHYLLKCPFLSYYNIRRPLFVRSLIAQLKSDKQDSKSACLRCRCWFNLIERLEKREKGISSPYLTLIYLTIENHFIASINIYWTPTICKDSITGHQELRHTLFLVNLNI
jgi:hypothetical protein